MTNLDVIIKTLLSSLSKRQQEVAIKRFSLNGSQWTLAAIGKKFGITRERVRQIEALALKNFKLKARDFKLARDFNSKIGDYLRKFEGVRRRDFLIKDLSSVVGRELTGRVQNLDAKIRFLLLAGGECGFFKADDNWHDFWHLNEDSKNTAFDYVKNLEDKLRDNKNEILTGQNSLMGDHFTNPVLVNFASLSKKFHTNVFNDFGLAIWPEIKPRAVGDKSYIILKKIKKPLHFKNLTAEINKAKFDDKKANPQTVHNELIKDRRFVLIGRGIYALKELGFQPGLAREVIERILQNKGSLFSHQIVALVKQERILKDNTILLNLQNKRYFQKLPDGRYGIIRQV